MKSEAEWMACCIETAKHALESGKIPVVAMAVQSDRVIGVGVSGCLPDNTQQSHFWNHAEILALLRAEQNVKDLLSPIALYTTLEPCMMCLGAAANLGVEKIVYAYPAKPDGAAWISQLPLPHVGKRSLFTMPSLRGPTAPAEMQGLFMKFLAAFPQHQAVDYVKGIVSTDYISGVRSHSNAAIFDDYYEGSGWTFGQAPTDLVVRLGETLPPRSHILELGAGDGRDTFYLARQGHSVLALDISSVAIQKIKARSENESQLKIETFVGDIMQLNSWKVRFDAIVGITVIDHIDEDDLGPVLDSIWNLLTDEGKIALQVHTRNDPGFLKHLDASETAQWVRHYFRRDELRRRLLDRYQVEFYNEWVEADHDHGAPHEHAFAGIVAKKKAVLTKPENSDPC